MHTVKRTFPKLSIVVGMNVHGVSEGDLLEERLRARGSKARINPSLRLSLRGTF
jgi:hypothetical protein